MPALTDIITGFDSIRAEGAAFVAEVSTSTNFELVDAERVVALYWPPYRPDYSPSVSARVSGPQGIQAGAVFILWQRRDGTYGAMAPLSGEGHETTLGSMRGGGLRLSAAGESHGPRPGMVFALAGDPYVAADFCRTAATRVAQASGMAAIAPPVSIRLANADPSQTVYAAAVAAIWFRPVALTAPSADEVNRLDIIYSAAAHALFTGPPAAAITRDRLFVDCRTEPKLLKMFAHKGRDGVLGLFNCYWPEDGLDHGKPEIGPITDTWTPGDVEGLGGEQFAAWHAVERKLFIIDRGIDETISLPPFGAEIVHLVPILQNVAPLGLIDQLNASASMTRLGSRKCRLIDGGTVGWYAAKQPTQVLLDGVAIAFDYEQSNGLVTFVAEVGRPHDSEVIL